MSVKVRRHEGGVVKRSLERPLYSGAILLKLNGYFDWMTPHTHIDTDIEKKSCFGILLL
jgi:hypothetical protein